MSLIVSSVPVERHARPVVMTTTVRAPAGHTTTTSFRHSEQTTSQTIRRIITDMTLSQNTASVTSRSSPMSSSTDDVTTNEKTATDRTAGTTNFSTSYTSPGDDATTARHRRDVDNEEVRSRVSSGSIELPISRSSAYDVTTNENTATDTRAALTAEATNSSMSTSERLRSSDIDATMSRHEELETTTNNRRVSSEISGTTVISPFENVTVDAAQRSALTGHVTELSGHVTSLTTEFDAEENSTLERRHVESSTPEISDVTSESEIAVMTSQHLPRDRSNEDLVCNIILLLFH